jgi:two-component system NarL family sensor kinase
VIAGDNRAFASFNPDTHRYVLMGSLVRIKVGRADGLVLCSDEPRLVGQTFPLGEDEDDALEDRSTDSEISDLSAPENVYQLPFGKLPDRQLRAGPYRAVGPGQGTWVEIVVPVG